MSRSTTATAAARRFADAAPVFAALGDETRLSIVARLCATGPQSIVRLTDGAKVTRQAITKHLEALADAGLVRSTREGRERIWEIQTKRLAEARGYLDAISLQWDDAIDRLRALVEEALTPVPWSRGGWHNVRHGAPQRGWVFRFGARARGVLSAKGMSHAIRGVVLALVTVMLVASSARAQDRASGERVPLAAQSPAFRDDPTPGRVALEYLGALGGVGVTVGVMFAVASGRDECLSDVCDARRGLSGILAAGILTSLVAVPLGAYALGSATGRQGSFWGAFGGHVLGGFAGAGLLAIASATHPGETAGTAIAIMALALEVTGAVVGLELSLSDEPPRRDVARRPRVMATAAPMIGGVTIGLSGEL